MISQKNVNQWKTAWPLSVIPPYPVRMASSLQNAFTRTLGNLSNTSSIKKIFSHGSLYLGILVYTAIGAKVRLSIMSKILPKFSICMNRRLQLISYILGVSTAGTSCRNWEVGDLPAASNHQEKNSSSKHLQFIFFPWHCRQCHTFSTG